jgi:hypothetical protein
MFWDYTLGESARLRNLQEGTSRSGATVRTDAPGKCYGTAQQMRQEIGYHGTTDASVNCCSTALQIPQEIV